MTKANRVLSTPRRTASKIDDPIVGLSKTFLALWDADDGAEREYVANEVVDCVKRETTHQFAEWRSAIQKVISFTSAVSIQGALVQMVLALDELDDLTSRLSEEDQKSIEMHELRIQRLLRSAIRAVQTSVGTDMDQDVRSIVEMYDGTGHIPLWIDRVKGWAQEGRRAREWETGR